MGNSHCTNAYTVVHNRVGNSREHTRYTKRNKDAAKERCARDKMDRATDQHAENVRVPKERVGNIGDRKKPTRKERHMPWAAKPAGGASEYPDGGASASCANMPEIYIYGL